MRSDSVVRALLRNKFAAAGLLPRATDAQRLLLGAGLGTALGVGTQALRNATREEDAPDTHASLIAGGLLGLLSGLGATHLHNVLYGPSVKGVLAQQRATVTPQRYAQIQERFKRLEQALEDKGVLAGTFHKRVAFPKESLTEKDLHALGFVKSRVAIPESGQNQFTSYRHPENNYHIHSHGDDWTMHLDAHPSSQMLVRRYDEPLARLGALLRGIPHVATEGVPGLYQYLRNKIVAAYQRKTPSMLARVQSEGGVFDPRVGEGAPLRKAASEEAEEQHRRAQRWIPALAALTAGLGTYGLLRRPAVASNNKIMQRLRDQANEHGFHRLIYLNDKSPSNPLLRRIYAAITPQLNERGQMNLWNRLKFHLREGVHAVPVATNAQGEQYIPLPGMRKGFNTRGVVMNRGEDAWAQRNVRGGVDLEGSESVQRRLNDMAIGGKGVEADIARRFIRKYYPESYTDLASFITPPQGDRYAQIREIQRRMQTHVGAGTDYVLKPTRGVQSRGEFPWGTRDWGADLARFDKKMADPAFARRLRAAGPAGEAALAHLLRKHRVLEGHTLDSFLRDPRTALLQRVIPENVRRGEYRVHAYGGEALPQPIIPRSAKHPLLSAADEQAMTAWVNKAMRRLPSKLRAGAYGFDVMRYEKPDGSIGHKFVELNPYERFEQGRTEGGGSGLIRSDYHPLVGHMIDRHITGRWSRPIAAVGGLAAAGAGALGGHMLNQSGIIDPEKQREDQHAA